ncbi:hypothetical protein SOVF_183570 [Spinacia oleracea]|nr:hypothetical protein SOVF_183570 [Spinacia oleracea]
MAATPILSGDLSSSSARFENCRCLLSGGGGYNGGRLMDETPSFNVSENWSVPMNGAAAASTLQRR